MLVEQTYWELSNYKQNAVSLFFLLYKNISIAQPEKKKNTFLWVELSSIVDHFRGNISAWSVYLHLLRLPISKTGKLKRSYFA